MTRSLVSIVLVLGAGSACAHRAPVERNSVSVVTNEEATDDKSEPGEHTMSYTKVNNEDALNHDQEHEEHEALYGHIAEAMLSQPATKIFFKTSEPHASEWISKSIGEVEVERFRESRTRGVFPHGRENEQREITREPLVMASEIGGLEPLHGYLKHGNLVVRMRIPHLKLVEPAEKSLHSALAKAIAAIAPALEKEDFAAAMREMAALRGPVDAFFDKVKVNADDPAVRVNRLSLLAGFRAALHTVADFSRIEG